MLKTSAYGLGFQHLPRDLANVNAWKTMFDPYIICLDKFDFTCLTTAFSKLTDEINIDLDIQKNGLSKNG